MLGDGARTSAQDDSDLAIRLALGDPRQHLCLARAETEGCEDASGHLATPLTEEQGPLTACRDQASLEARPVSLDHERQARRRQRVAINGHRSLSADPVG